MLWRADDLEVEMFNGRPRAVLLAVAMLLAGGALLVTHSTAPAEADHKGGVHYCGEGDYVYLDHTYLHLPNGDVPGRLVLTKHRRTDTFCAVTIRKFHNGRRWTVAKIKRQAQGRWAHQDRGFFTEFAGPPHTYLSRNGGTIVAYGKIGSRWAKHWWNPEFFCKQWKGFEKSCWAQ
jgi:hypothetical protein